MNATGNQNTSGSAATLTTARTIGGVSFDGSSNIDLPGVNATGNQNTSGNAATATTLATTRTINNVGFNGSSNIKLPGTIVIKRMLDKSLGILSISTTFKEINSHLRIKYVATQTNITCHFNIARIRSNFKFMYYQVYDWNNDTHHGSYSQYYFHYSGSTHFTPLHIVHTIHNLTVGNTYYFTIRFKTSSGTAYIYPSYIYGVSSIYLTEHITGSANSGTGFGRNITDTEVDV